MYGESEIEATARAVVEMAGLALAFGRVDRTCVSHQDGMPESDSDHTVMLTWIAPSLADLINKRVGFEKHNTMRVAAYAAVHDAVEVYAGDTPTIRITPEELLDKAQREEAAAARLVVQFRQRLPWFARMVQAYEAQADLDARLVRAVDKLLPKAVHAVNDGADLVRHGFTRNDFDELATRQRDQLIALGNDELVRRVYDRVVDWVFEAVDTRMVANPPAPNPQPMHLLVVSGGQPSLTHFCRSLVDCPLVDPFNFFRTHNTERLRDGQYPVELRDGQLAFVGN